MGVQEQDLLLVFAASAKVEANESVGALKRCAYEADAPDLSHWENWNLSQPSEVIGRIGVLRNHAQSEAYEADAPELSHWESWMPLQTTAAVDDNQSLRQILNDAVTNGRLEAALAITAVKSQPTVPSTSTEALRQTLRKTLDDAALGNRLGDAAVTTRPVVALDCALASTPRSPMPPQGRAGAPSFRRITARTPSRNHRRIIGGVQRSTSLAQLDSAATACVSAMAMDLGMDAPAQKAVVSTTTPLELVIKSYAQGTQSGLPKLPQIGQTHRPVAGSMTWGAQLARSAHMRGLDQAWLVT